MKPYQTLVAQTEDERFSLFNLPVMKDVADGNFTVDTYLQFLANAYHHVRFTVPLMMGCGAHLADGQSWLTAKLQEYIDEEIGHELWILDDITAAGGDAAATARSIPNLQTELLVAYVRDYISHRNALGFFGMVFVLEGTSTMLATGTANTIQQHLQLPDTAFTYLHSHGELDQEHIRFFADLVNQLPAEDLDHVIHVAKRVYWLYGAVLASATTPGIAHAA